MKYPRYPKYKDSGVEWLGQVPEGWEVRRLKYVAFAKSSNVDKLSKEDELEVFLCNYTDVYNNDTISSDIDFMKATATGSEMQQYSLHTECVIITKDSESWQDIAVPAYVENGLKNVLCGYHLAIIKSEKLVAKFLYYLLASNLINQQFQIASNGVTRFGLPQIGIASAWLLSPLISEQQAIASFLDKECARIDALIAKKRRLLELLEEKRRAVITQAVTRGLDPSVPMKDSGVEWLGSIPHTWELKRLKFISPMITVGIVVNPSNYLSEEGLPYIYGGDIKEGRIESQSARRISSTDSILNSKTLLHEGDLLTVRVGYPGITSVVPHECEGGNCASVMLIRKGNFDSKWLSYAMNSTLIRAQINMVKYGAAQEQFNIAHAVEFFSPTPTFEGQQAIASYLDATTVAIDAQRQAHEKSVALLQEYRASLITHAVTGKIDVRDYAPRQ